MKYLLTLILFPFISYSQSFLLLDYTTKKPVKEASVFDEKKGTISDTNGMVNINGFKKKDSVNIQHISYYHKYIRLPD